MPILVAMLSKAWVHGQCCVMSGRGLCICQLLVLRSPTECCVSNWVWSGNLHKEEA